jgi:glycosyltransferase involved in cell wall biosynthesis
MRLAIIAEVFLPKIDGVVHRTMNLIHQLRRSGDEVLVVCPQADGCRNCPVPVVPCRSFSFPLYPEYRIGLPDEHVVKAVEQFAPDVLHYVNPFAFGFRCYDLFQRSGFAVPTVFSFHTLYGEFVKQYPVLRPLSALVWWLMREYHNCADINLTVSTIMQEELINRGFERVKCWPPAVDSSLFRPEAQNPAMRARLSGGRTDRKLLLTVSRLAPEKNVSFLADVLDQIPEACLAIVGDGPHRAALERRFAGRDAHFIGYLKGEELAAAYASADAFLYASETETLGNVVLEAMASGCAVVVPDAGGIPSLIHHSQNGMLYKPGDVAEAVRYTRQLLRDVPLRLRLGQAARSWVEDRSWSSSVQRVRQIYQEAIAAGPQAATRSTWRHRLAHGLVTGLVSGFKTLAGNETVLQPG